MKELIQFLVKVFRFLILIFVPFFIIGALNGFVFKDFSAIQWLFLVILIWIFDEYID